MASDSARQSCATAERAVGDQLVAGRGGRGRHPRRVRDRCRRCRVHGDPYRVRVDRRVTAAYSGRGCLTLVACDDDGGGETPPPWRQPAGDRAGDHRGDHRRRRRPAHRAAAPASGRGGVIGEPLIAAALVTAEAINTAGGVLGQPVEVVTEYDEGDDEATARDAIAGLIEADVDAVVGPASSTITLAGSTTCCRRGSSPARRRRRRRRSTTSPTPSCSSGPRRAIRSRPSSSPSSPTTPEPGRSPSPTSTTRTAGSSARRRSGPPLAGAGGRGGAALLRPGRGSLVDEAELISSSDVDVVIVLGDGEHGARCSPRSVRPPASRPANGRRTSSSTTPFRNPPSPQVIQGLATEVREQITGVSPLAIDAEEGEPHGPFATNAADCVNLIALAAVAAGK